jgi:DNA-binding transcriptional ArsR family regulator
VDLEERSKLLFGNRHRLRIGNCVARRTLVTAREIASELRLADSVVRAELLRLAAAGLLVALPSVQKERYFELVADPFWDYCREEVARFGTPQVAPRSNGRPSAPG